MTESLATIAPHKELFLKIRISFIFILNRSVSVETTRTKSRRKSTCTQTRDWELTMKSKFPSLEENKCH